MQGRYGRQTRLDISRADRNLADRRHDGRAALRRTELGTCRRRRGKVAGNAPGKAANDIPWLKLDVVSKRGSGILSGATTVQRINTQGGKLQGDCDKAGAFRSEPYAADYVFLRK